MKMEAWLLRVVGKRSRGTQPVVKRRDGPQPLPYPLCPPSLLLSPGLGGRRAPGGGDQDAAAIGAEGHRLDTTGEGSGAKAPGVVGETRLRWSELCGVNKGNG